MRLRPLGRTGTGVCAFALLMFAAPGLIPDSHAGTAAEIDASVNAALARFGEQVPGANNFLRAGKGVLIFGGVLQAGVGIGGEYGEGALRIQGKTVDYYNIASASVGFQFGGQRKDVILVFMQDQALKDFRASSGWNAGVDGSVALINVGAGGNIDTTTVKDPIVGFVIGQQGLMFNLSLEGTKISKLDR
jgi:lipid-binding SYLF domain-containing protein